MRKIISGDNKNIGIIANSQIFKVNDKSFIPVFETEKEFVYFYGVDRKSDIDTLAKKLFDSASDEEKWFYGKEYVEYNCRKSAEKMVIERENKYKLNAITKAKVCEGDYYSILHEVYMTRNDMKIDNLGIFTSEELAQNCAQTLSQVQKLNCVYVVDKNGDEVEDDIEREG